MRAANNRPSAQFRTLLIAPSRSAVPVHFRTECERLVDRGLNPTCLHGPHSAPSAGAAERTNQRPLPGWRAAGWVRPALLNPEHDLIGAGSELGYCVRAPRALRSPPSPVPAADPSSVVRPAVGSDFSRRLGQDWIGGAGGSGWHRRGPEGGVNGRTWRSFCGVAMTAGSECSTSSGGGWSAPGDGRRRNCSPITPAATMTSAAGSRAEGAGGWPRTKYLVCPKRNTLA